MRTLESNAVYGGLFRDLIVGFRCSECGKVVGSMMGDICNECVEKERRHREIIAAIKSAAKERV